MNKAVSVPMAVGRECTGGDDDEAGGDALPGDSALRLGIAYLFAQIGRGSLALSIRLMPADHPWRATVGGAFHAVNDRVSKHPRLGMVARCGHKPHLARNLWFVAAALAAFLLLSDALAVGPIDLGLLPDQHIGLHRLLGLPWWGGADRAGESHAAVFNHPLRWHDVVTLLYGRR